jgi:hypothetical protein
MGLVSSTQVATHFVSSLAWEGFGQYMLTCIFCLRWHGMGLIKACKDAYSVLAGMGGVWSTQVELHFVSSLAWDESFFVLADMKGIWLTHVEINTVSSLAWEVFG